MRRGAGIALVLLATAAVACKPGETDEQKTARMQAETDSATAAVRASAANWMRFANQNHPDSIATLFVENGAMMPPDVPGAMGRDSITKANHNLVIPGGTLPRKP